VGELKAAALTVMKRTTIVPAVAVVTYGWMADTLLPLPATPYVSTGAVVLTPL
jgi:hypothetical protein